MAVLKLWKTGWADFEPYGRKEDIEKRNEEVKKWRKVYKIVSKFKNEDIVEYVDDSDDSETDDEDDEEEEH